jgi:hypothetical protein
MEIEKILNTHFIPNLINSIISLVSYQYNNYQISFFSWLITSSDEDFKYLYIQEFKKNFQIYYTKESIYLLTCHSQNLSYSIYSFYEIERDFNKLIIFIKNMLNLQFKNFQIN